MTCVNHLHHPTISYSVLTACICFQTQANQLAAGFVALKLKRGDRVGIWGPNSYEWTLTQWAAARAGLVLVCHFIKLESQNDLDNIVMLFVM